MNSFISSFSCIKYQILKTFILGSLTVSEFVAATIEKTEGLLYCKCCDYTNRYLTNIRTHIENNHLPEHLRQVACDICNYVCPSKSALRQHVKNKH